MGRLGFQVLILFLIKWDDVQLKFCPTRESSTIILKIIDSIDSFYKNIGTIDSCDSEEKELSGLSIFQNY